MDDQKRQVMNATAERIRHLRKQRDISQEELALRAGINTVYYGQIERGQKCPTVDTLYKIAAALEIPLHNLLCFELLPQTPEETDHYVMQLLKRIPPSKIPQVIRILEEVANLI